MEKPKNRYLPLIGSMYTNYIFQGMAAIILSQNLTALTEHWQASVQEVSLVMSAIGLGRVIILYFAGYFSDRFGRKRTVQIGIISYFFFFLGIIASQNYIQGFVFAIFGGFSNAFLDTSTYPTLVEAYPSEKENSSLSVLNKAFISLGQFILPFLVRFVINNELYFGWVFIFCAVGLGLNLIYISNKKFPPIKIEETPKAEAPSSSKVHGKPLFKFEGIALLIFSFTSVTTFNIFILWAPRFAESLKLVNEADSLIFVSIYSVGSFISVFLTSYLVKKGMDSSLLIVVCTFISFLLLLGMTIFPSIPMFWLGSLGVGVFAAGGIWQLGLAILLEFFPKQKGRTTSLYSLATSVSVMITPYITGQLEKFSLSYIFWYNIVLTGVGVAAGLIIYYRYQKLTQENKKETQEDLFLASVKE